MVFLIQKHGVAAVADAALPSFLANLLFF